ncbi:MAG: acyltransferase family protein [Bacteroidaceae bacterium]|nr:acyltransferase family protein [Bacteroidaceae bacterium]
MNKSFTHIFDINLQSAVLSQRSFLMGIAILLILIYHAFNFIYNPLWRLNIGYVGVDIFLFLSGFGLSRSYEKHSLPVFYFHRIRNVYPLYIICVTIVYAILYNVWTIEDYLNNILTLGYYIDFGIHRFDWFLESLFTLYFIFPVIYYLSSTRLTGLFICFLAVYAVLTLTELNWWYDCLIARIPIFLMGIMVYRYDINVKPYIFGGLVVALPTYIFISPFLSVTFLALPILIIAIKFREKHDGAWAEKIQSLGKYTLEIYCANNIIHKVFTTYDMVIWQKCLIYIFLQALVALLFVKLRKAMTLHKS